MTNKEINDLFINYMDKPDDKTFELIYINLKPYIRGMLQKNRDYFLITNSKGIEFDDVYQDVMLQFFNTRHNVNLEISSVVTLVVTMFINRLKNIKKRSNIKNEISIKNFDILVV